MAKLRRAPKLAQDEVDDVVFIRNSRLDETPARSDAGFFAGIFATSLGTAFGSGTITGGPFAIPRLPRMILALHDGMNMTKE